MLAGGMLRALLAIACFFCGVVAAGVGVYVLRSLSMPDLEPWHREAFTEDVVSELDDLAGASLAAYLEREDRIFEQLARAEVEQHRRRPLGRYSRFRPDGDANPANQPRNWNRTFELEAAEPRGGALLVHGLSDSPYSMRAIGKRLHAAGYHVVGLRMPGHGTIPGGLREATWRDFRAAFRVGARHLASRIGPERPLVLVGYSNGTTLAVDYALRAVRGEVERRPDLLILISPAMRVHPVAAFARFQRWVAALPGLEKLAWTTVLPEYEARLDDGPARVRTIQVQLVPGVCR
jgi:alpha-beta hydrolase superfamily lysophospholipase